MALSLAYYVGFSQDTNNPNLGEANSTPCIPQATSWHLGGNNIQGANVACVTCPPPFYNDAGTCNNYPFILKANNNKSVLIMPSGDIGIGTANPAQLLHLQKTGDAALRIDALGNAGKPWDIVSSAGQGQLNSGNFGIFDTQANTFRFNIDNGGNVGIGTVMPTERLHVANGNLRVEGNSHIQANEQIDGNSTVNGNGHYSGNLRVNGTLGLNITPSNGYKVDIFDGTNGSLRVITGSNNEAKLTVANGLLGYDFKVRSDGTGQIAVASGGTQFLNFRSNGTLPQVWIGGRPTTGVHANDFSFAVSGKCVAQSIFVTMNTVWADYVFDKNYKLASLSEVEEFIKKNKHLPNVPSASDLEKEYALNVAEMQNIQMEKIEEIFLHLIEMKKEIEKLKIENEHLKKIGSN